MPAQSPDFADGGAHENLLAGMADAGIKIDRIIQTNLAASCLEQPTGFVALDFHQYLTITKHCGTYTVMQMKSKDCVAWYLPWCAGILLSLIHI